MKSLKNFVDIWWHVIKHLDDYNRPHEVKYTYIDIDKHYYCNCGYMKPVRIKVDIRN